MYSERKRLSKKANATTTVKPKMTKKKLKIEKKKRHDNPFR